MNDSAESGLLKPVDIRQVFRAKNPRLARMIPGFVYRYLERIVHQKDINAFLSVHGHKTGLDFVHAAIEDFNVSLQVNGEENLERNGRFIFACNHPWGGFDGMLLMDVLARHYSDFRVLVNDILMYIANLHGLFIPINKHGKQDPEAARVLHETYLSNVQIVTFPSGFVSRYIGGRVMDMVWKKNFISKAVQYRRDIIPVFFDGRNSRFFYALYLIRKFLGIKTNLEMLYLVDETYRHRNKNLAVTFGRPIPYTTFDRSKSPMQWAKWVKEQVYALGGITDIPV